MTRKVSLKIKFNLFLVFLLLGTSFILATIFIDIHKKSFLSLLKKDFLYQINEFSTYLDFQDELRKERRKSINFDEDVYESFKKYTLSKKIEGNGQFIVFNKKGNLLIHSTDEGKNVSQEFYVNKILSSNIKENSFHFNDLKDFSNKYAVYKYHETYGIYLCLLADWTVATAPVSKMRTIILVSFLISSLLIIILFNIFYNSIHASIISVYRTLKNFVSADFSNTIKLGNTKEFHEISLELDAFKNYLLQNINFAQNISNGKLDLSFQPINKNDQLGLSLIKVRDNMGSAKDEQERRKVEDEKQNWLNKGLANFSDLLRLHNSDLKKHSDIIVQNLVSYIGANQGAIFIANKDDANANFLEMISAFAYNTLKYIQKNIPIGEGLVGTCAIEKRTIFLKEIPDNYIEITSGLGHANPRCILIVPIKMEEEILGVVELASFKVFEKHEIYFVEKIMESFASTLSSAKINAQTANLLKRFELQNEQMKTQEEEMRQNMEELNAIQEDAEALKIELTREIDLIANTVFICEYYPNGKVKDVKEKYAEFLGYGIEEVSSGDIENHIKIGFLKYDKSQFEILEHVCEKNSELVLRNLYNVEGKEVYLEERFVLLKDHRDVGLKILRIGINKTEIKLKDDEITNLILKERNLYDELNKANDTIKTLENNLRNS